MSEYPDPDEEYELMYADDLELLQDDENDAGRNVIRQKTLPAKRSLDFSSPVVKRNQPTDNINTVQNSQILFSQSLQPVENLTPVTSNKRTAEELFGDIGDIDFNELELPSKKQKTDEETDLDLINKILEERKLRQILAEPLRGQGDAQSSYDVKDNISLNIPRWPFMPVTNPDGDRMYVKLESEELWDKSLDAASDLSLHINYSSTWEEARKILELKEQQQVNEEALTQNIPNNVESNIDNTSLWVDKYKPDSYVDLLSEEPVNRALLHWLHLWDKVVFKREVKVIEPQQRNSFSKRAGQFQLSSQWRGQRRGGGAGAGVGAGRGDGWGEGDSPLGSDGRPLLRVALLCGPPGVGKTTLAHLLARLAGYRVVELNASDERSTEAFRNALQSATLMRSVLDAEKRPNCLILDEIDGAPLPTVELLVKWCTASAESGKKKARFQPLKRPVIAICNDLYAPSLRPLRPVALVVMVGAGGVSRLAARLGGLAAREGLRLGARAAQALAQRAQGDVRAAVHVLSFLRGAGKTLIETVDVENVAIGTKDCNKSVMQALQAIFTINDKDPDSVLKTVQAAGEYDRIADGIFENYLSARVDSRLWVARGALLALRQFDALQAWTQRHQNYSLYAALPLCLASLYRLLASRSSQKVKFPSQAQEMYRKKVELDSIVTSVWRGSCPAVLKPKRALQLDVLPLLPYLLAPKLRSANVQLCSEKEREALRSCAGAMCEYGLQYVQRRQPDSLYTFQLEPDLYNIAFFGSEERIRPPPAVRQAIAREQQLEFIRRNEEMANRVSGNPRNDRVQPKEADTKDVSVSNESVSKETRLPNHLQRLKPKEVEKTAPQVHKDFFGRVVPISQVQRKDVNQDLISSSGVFYQYREGFNNAVRKNVRTKDLL